MKHIVSEGPSGKGLDGGGGWCRTELDTAGNSEGFMK